MGLLALATVFIVRSLTQVVHLGIEGSKTNLPPFCLISGRSILESLPWIFIGITRATT
jgi:hypothetical protein